MQRQTVRLRSIPVGVIPSLVFIPLQPVLGVLVMSSWSLYVYNTVFIVVKLRLLRVALATELSRMEGKEIGVC